MSRISIAPAIAVLSLLVAGCCCDPCRSRCRPCCPPPVAAAPGAPAPQQPGGVVLRIGEGGEGTEGRVVLIGPDGKTTTLQGEGVKLEVDKEGRWTVRPGPGGTGTVVVVSESEEREGAEGAEKGEHSAPATAPPAVADRGFVGFTPAPVAALSAKQREKLKVKADRGVVVARVLEGSPAEKAGLHVGDVLVRYAGQDVPSAGDFGEAFAKISAGVKPGAKVEIVVDRDGKRTTLEATAIDFAAMGKIAKASGEDDDDEGDEDDEGHEKGEGTPKGPGPSPGAPAK